MSKILRGNVPEEIWENEYLRKQEKTRSIYVSWHSRLEAAETIATEAFLNAVQNYNELIIEQQSSTETTLQYEILLKWLDQNRIKIPEPGKVRSYLANFPDMTNTIPSICKMVKDTVDKETQLSLEVYQDPEIEDEYLTLYIRKNHYDEGILDLIEKISENFQKELSKKLGWLVVTTDFRPPIE